MEGNGRFGVLEAFSQIESLVDDGTNLDAPPLTSPKVRFASLICLVFSPFLSRKMRCRAHNGAVSPIATRLHLTRLPLAAWWS
jgi:hypothetical protein